MGDAVLTLTIASLRRHDACDLDDRIADLHRVLPDAADDDPIPLRIWWDLPSTSIPDCWWSLRAAEPQLESRRLAVRAVCLAARRVLPLTREQDRSVCVEAIEAAEAWADEPTAERARACQIAANAANAAYAAYAANAAYAAAARAAAADAAYAAYAADATAAYAAAYSAAATAAADAAYAAYATAAADAAERATQRADLDRLLEEVSRG
jgi:hypothetical protein